MSNVQVWVAMAAVSMAAPLLAQTGEPLAEVVIRDISVVDVEAGRMLPARDIVVRGTHVERVTPAGGALPRGKTQIEGRGKFAIPGLIDAPVRLAAFSPATLQEVLAAGITTVGDVGTEPARLDRWRRDLNTGRLYAPRIAQGCEPAGTPARRRALRRRRRGRCMTCSSASCRRVGGPPHRRCARSRSIAPAGGASPDSAPLHRVAPPISSSSAPTPSTTCGTPAKSMPWCFAAKCSRTPISRCSGGVRCPRPHWRVSEAAVAVGRWPL